MLSRTSMVLLLLLSATSVFSGILKGVVTEGATGVPMSAVTVTNLFTGALTYTDSNGVFNLVAQKGELISFAFPGYRPQQKSVSVSIQGIEDMSIQLFSLSYELDEYVFRSKYTPYQLDSIERRATYARPLARQKGGSLMSPITLLAEKLSGNSKRIFRFQQQFMSWEKEKFTASRYTEALTTALTGLHGDTLAHFMNINPIPYDFVRAASELELKMWIRERYRIWLQQPEYPPVIITPGDAENR